MTPEGERAGELPRVRFAQGSGAERRTERERGLECRHDQQPARPHDGPEWKIGLVVRSYRIHRIEPRRWQVGAQVTTCAERSVNGG
ncbi:MAG: hypothetical protein JWM47_234 [Acidimicrobiales bacterium]|nr:hypothetical protein [Acidimicrobiales bacterium]